MLIVIGLLRVNTPFSTCSSRIYPSPRIVKAIEGLTLVRQLGVHGRPMTALGQDRKRLRPPQDRAFVFSQQVGAFGLFALGQWPLVHGVVQLTESLLL